MQLGVWRLAKSVHVEDLGCQGLTFHLDFHDPHLLLWLEGTSQVRLIFELLIDLNGIARVFEGLLMQQRVAMRIYRG